jgi:hypothetical protein
MRAQFETLTIAGYPTTPDGGTPRGLGPGRHRRGAPRRQCRAASSRLRGAEFDRGRACTRSRSRAVCTERVLVPGDGSSARPRRTLDTDTWGRTDLIVVARTTLSVRSLRRRAACGGRVGSLRRIRHGEAHDCERSPGGTTARRPRRHRPRVGLAPRSGVSRAGPRHTPLVADRFDNHRTAGRAVWSWLVEMTIDEE